MRYAWQNIHSDDFGNISRRLESRKGKERAEPVLSSASSIATTTSATVTATRHAASRTGMHVAVSEAEITFIHDSDSDSDDDFEVLSAEPAVFKRPLAHLPERSYPTPESMPQSTPPFRAAESFTSSSTADHCSVRRHSDYASPDHFPFPFPGDDLISQRESLTAHRSSPSNSAGSSSSAVQVVQRKYGVKNTGLQATQDLKRGSVIVSEAPFLVVPDLDEITTEDIHEEVHSLSAHDKRIFKSFTRRADEGAEPDEWVNTVETNGIPLAELDEETSDIGSEEAEGKRRLGLFVTICRVNHSCTPNAGWCWDSAEGKMYLYAYTNISIGEEITCSYLEDPELTASFAAREQRLSQGFGFLCACTSCALYRTDPSKRRRSDSHLAQYTALRQRWESGGPLDLASDRGSALHMLDRALALLKKEKKIHAQGEILEDTFFVYVVHGKKEEAKIAAKKVVEHNALIIGRERADDLDYAQWAEDPRTHEYWDELQRRKALQRRPKPKVQVKMAKKERKAKT